MLIRLVPESILTLISILSWSDFKTYGRVLLTCFIGMAVTTLFILTFIFGMLVNDYSSRLVKVDSTEGLDISLMCNVVNCSYVKAVKKDSTVTYKNINNILKPTLEEVNEDLFFFSKHFTWSLDTMLTHYDSESKVSYRFFINDRPYLYTIVVVLYISFFIFASILSFLWFVLVLFRKSTELKERHNFKNVTQNEARHGVLESLNHEMRVPVEINKCLLKELFLNLYPCSYTDTGICDFQEGMVSSKKCEGCPHHKSKRAIDKVAIEYYYQMVMNLEKLEAIMGVLSGGKRIKYSNGNISLYEMIQNTMDTMNSFTYPKIGVEYVGEDLLHKYAVGGQLVNGDILLLLNVMVNNSIEAKARQMTFTASMEKDNSLILYVEDDGRGIRDMFDNVIPDERIFQYSFSTKDLSGKQMKAESWLEKFACRIGLINTFGDAKRGVGLHVQKANFCAGGGAIKIHKTTPAGTIFKLIIPVKERRDGKKATTR